MAGRWSGAGAAQTAGAASSTMIMTHSGITFSRALQTLSYRQQQTQIAPHLIHPCTHPAAQDPPLYKTHRQRLWYRFTTTWLLLHHQDDSCCVTLPGSWLP